RSTIEQYPARSGRQNAFNGTQPEFILTERKNNGLCLEREHTKTDHYKGKVYCATVPNGTLITRKDKRILISSNCWDFSGTGVIEIAGNKAGIGGGPNKFVLSEEYTLGCGKNGGCGGDDNVTVLDWAKSTGIPLTSDYGPYTEGGKCKYKV